MYEIKSWSNLLDEFILCYLTLTFKHILLLARMQGNGNKMVHCIIQNGRYET